MLATKTSSNKLTRLRHSASCLFVSRGYHATRPQDIARHAGVANGTFYMHFKDKQAAFLDFAEQAQQALIACFETNLAGVSGHRNRWRVIVRTLITFATEHPGVLNMAFMDPVLIAPDNDAAWRIYDRMGHFIDLALDESETRACMSEFNLQLISHSISGILRHAMTYAARQPQKTGSAEELIDELSLFIDRGLGFESSKAPGPGKNSSHHLREADQ